MVLHTSETTFGLFEEIVPFTNLETTKLGPIASQSDNRHAL